MTTEIDKSQFRDAMAHLGAAVNVITSDGPSGRVGFTATAVCSVTDSPATLLICLNHSASAYQTVIDNGRLCVNTLSAEQSDLARHFGGKIPHDERFGIGNWRRSATGQPVLTNALLSFDCKIDTWQDVGTHRVLFCRVEAVQLSEGKSGLAYFGRKFMALQAA